MRKPELLTRRSFAFALGGAAFAADTSLKPLKIELGPERMIAPTVQWPYLVQLRDGTTILLGHVGWPPGGKFPIHYTAVSHDGRKTWKEWKPGPSQGLGPITEGSAVELRSGPLLVFSVHAEHLGNKVFGTNYWTSRDSYRTLEGPKSSTPFRCLRAKPQGKDDRGEPISRMYLRRSILELKNGDLLASCYGRFESDKAPSEYRGVMSKSRSFLLRSSDRGADLEVCRHDRRGSGRSGGYGRTRSRATFPGVSGGAFNLLSFVQVARTPFYQCESDDEGKTWTRAYPLSWQYSRFGRRRDIVGVDPDVTRDADNSTAGDVDSACR